MILLKFTDKQSRNLKGSYYMSMKYFKGDLSIMLSYNVEIFKIYGGFNVKWTNRTICVFMEQLNENFKTVVTHDYFKK